MGLETNHLQVVRCRSRAGLELSVFLDSLPLPPWLGGAARCSLELIIAYHVLALLYATHSTHFFRKKCRIRHIFREKNKPHGCINAARLSCHLLLQQKAAGHLPDDVFVLFVQLSNVIL